MCAGTLCEMNNMVQLSWCIVQIAWQYLSSLHLQTLCVVPDVCMLSLTAQIEVQLCMSSSACGAAVSCEVFMKL